MGVLRAGQHGNLRFSPRKSKSDSCKGTPHATAFHTQGAFRFPGCNAAVAWYRSENTERWNCQAWFFFWGGAGYARGSVKTSGLAAGVQDRIRRRTRISNTAAPGGPSGDACDGSGGGELHSRSSSSLNMVRRLGPWSEVHRARPTGYNQLGSQGLGAGEIWPGWDESRRHPETNWSRKTAQGPTISLQ